jgi:acyl-CoA synthetase (AMP-forming)/AMP-acid ligase II
VTFNLADLFERVVETVPTSLAIVSGDRRLSYAELDERANRLANHLRAQGVGIGDFVGLQLANGSEYIEAMLACFKLRAVPINVNYRYVDEELRYLYRDAGLVGLIAHRQFADRVAAAASEVAEPRVLLEVDDGSPVDHLVGSHDYEAVLAAASPHRPSGPRSGDDRYCVYTGGTTGMPKGVLWRHEDIFFAAMGGGDPMQLGRSIDDPDELPSTILRPGLVALATPPLMHASAHWLAFSTLFGGGTVVLLGGGHFDPVKAVDVIEREHANIVVVVGDAMAVPILDELDRRHDAGAPADVSSVMAVGSGGALLSPSSRRRLAKLLPGVMVVDGFGSSETGLVGNSQAPVGEHGAIRLTVDEATTVIDDSGEVVAPGSSVVGLLARRGRVPLGYHGDAEKTAATFVEVGGHRWAIPGDLARVEADGTIVVLGRASQCINTGGEKVYPEEVESALRDHVDVADAVVVGLPDARWGQRVVAVAASRPGTEPTLAELREHLRPRVAAYKMPKQLVLVPVVERSPSGKADYRWAQEQASRAAYDQGR